MQRPLDEAGERISGSSEEQECKDSYEAGESGAGPCKPWDGAYEGPDRWLEGWGEVGLTVCGGDKARVVPLGRLWRDGGKAGVLWSVRRSAGQR